MHPAILARAKACRKRPTPGAGVWRDRYRSIANQERRLCTNGTRIIKFNLHAYEEALAATRRVRLPWSVVPLPTTRRPRA